MTQAETTPMATDPLLLLGRISVLAASGDQTNSLIYRVLELLVENTPISGAWVLLPDGQGQLSIHFAHGLSPEEIRNGHYGIDEGNTGKVMSQHRQIIIEKPGRDPNFIARIKTRQQLNRSGETWIGEPMIINGQSVGVLACLCPPPLAMVPNLLPTVATLLTQLIRLKELSRKTDLRQRELDPPAAGNVDARETYGLLGRSAALSRAVDKARRAAASDAPVMLIGESGTGKERFARMIHLASDRRDRPFVGINCATIPENLLESELFGHEKGAFTGATATRIGKLEVASGGTLFLDEIGEMDLSLQAKLLRVLQEHSICRLGSNREIPTDIRIITATNRNLEQAVNVCTFRLDLYYRLNVVRIQLPALRERGEDIRLLARYFLMRENQRHGRNILLSDTAMALLEEYAWPGNVRQLENFITQLVIMSESEEPEPREIEAWLQDEAGITIEIERAGNLDQHPSPPPTEPETTTGQRPYQRVVETRPEDIQSALRRSRGNKTAAARLLGMSARQLQYRIRKLGL